jgi:hypothetical protein
VTGCEFRIANWESKNAAASLRRHFLFPFDVLENGQGTPAWVMAAGSETLALLATASTESPKGKEAYLWFPWLPPAAKARPLLLNNRNLATATNPANFITPPIRKATVQP